MSWTRVLWRRRSHQTKHSSVTDLVWRRPNVSFMLNPNPKSGGDWTGMKCELDAWEGTVEVRAIPTWLWPAPSRGRIAFHSCQGQMEVCGQWQLYCTYLFFVCKGNINEPEESAAMPLTAMSLCTKPGPERKDFLSLVEKTWLACTEPRPRPLLSASQALLLLLLNESQSLQAGYKIC